MTDHQSSEYQIEVRYPKTLNKFKQIQKEQLELFCKKQLDYGPSNIGLGKSKPEKPEDIRLSAMGLGIRMQDKISRFLNLSMNDKEPNNESLDDTLIDIANYAIMGLIVRNKKWGK
tara:strand:- start:8754 stop:9101 length:348 start_codon:yes stop_codon:yes gene_type:complete